MTLFVLVARPFSSMFSTPWIASAFTIPHMSHLTSISATKQCPNLHTQNNHVSSTRLFASKKNSDYSTQNLPLQNVDYTSELNTSLGGYNRPIINWYPGHIAKAETLLSETLKSVDIVIEVRDSRVLQASSHPSVPKWVGGKPRILIGTKSDLIPKQNLNRWRRWWTDYGRLPSEKETEADLEVANKAMQIWNERLKYTKDLTNNPETNNKETIMTQVEDVLFVDAKRGQGIHAIHRAIQKAGQHVNERRARRGLSERALRVGVIGYPNVGKSALINRILGRKRARSSNTPGVTRSLQWIRVRSTSGNKSKEFELLDSPGIIPANMQSRQSDAMLLAACHSIGSNAYDHQAVASYFMEWMKTLHIMNQQELSAPYFQQKCKERYFFDPMEPIPIDTSSMFDDDDDDNDDDGTPKTRFMTGEDMLFKVADTVCKGDPETAARKILQDFRSGRLGPIALQFAPPVPSSNANNDQSNSRNEDTYNVEKNIKRGIVDYSALVGGGPKNTYTVKEDLQARQLREEQEKQDRAKAAVELANQKGLELPPMILEDEHRNDDTEDKPKSSIDKRTEEIGKGMFDGW